MSYNHPRKRRVSPPLARSTSPPQHPFSLPNQHLFLTAHEATLIRNQPALAAKVFSREEGGRLQPSAIQAHDGAEVWVDRYDALHLLTELPPPPTLLTSSTQPDSTEGFEDLPSDSEEMFFLDREEIERVRRAKKRRRLEQDREERLLAREQEEKEKEAVLLEQNAPSDTQLALMAQLHATLQQAKDPKILEIRILANHGSDPRFAFLRKGGRWSDVWEEMRRPPTSAEAGQAGSMGLGGLAQYGSDSESEEEEGEGGALPDASLLISSSGEFRGDAVTGSAESSAEEPMFPIELDSDEERRKQEAKKAKAREWAQKRQDARDALELSAPIQ